MCPNICYTKQMSGGARKNEKKENEKKNAICFHLHSLLPNNKASINVDGTLLEQKIYVLRVQHVQRCGKKQTNKISMRLRCRHSTVDFIDHQKTDIPKLTCRGGMWDVFLLLKLCFLPSPVATVLYRWPTARLQQLQCVINGATAVPHQAIDT